MKHIEPCSEKNSQNSCIEELEKEGPIVYDVTTKTCDDDNSGTDQSILLNIITEKGISQTKMLSENGFINGQSSSKKLNINLNGEIKGIKLSLAGNGSWKPCLLMINNLITGVSKRFSLNNIMLRNPGQKEYTLDLRKRKNKTNNEKQIKNEEGTIEINNPDGGLINPNEMKSKTHFN